MRNACTKCIHCKIKKETDEEIIHCTLKDIDHEMYEDELMAMICIDFSYNNK